MDGQAIPQLKYTVQRTDLTGRIYLRSSAVTTELSGVHQGIVEMLDGEHTVAQIVDALENRGFQAEHVKQALAESPNTTSIRR